MRSLITPSLQIDTRAVGLEAITHARAAQKSDALRYGPAMRKPYLRHLRESLDYMRHVANNRLYQAFIVHRRQQMGERAAEIKDLEAAIDKLENPSLRPNFYSYAPHGTAALKQELAWLNTRLAALQSEKEAA